MQTTDQLTGRVGTCERHALLMDTDTREVLVDGRHVELTRTEFDLLSVLHDNPRRVLTPDQLLASLWGSDFSADGHPIEVYVHRLRAKLGESGRHPRFIHTVRGVGYRFEPGPSAAQRVRLTYSEAGVLLGIDPVRTQLWGWPTHEILGQQFVLMHERTIRHFRDIFELVGTIEELTPRIHIDTHIAQRDGFWLPVNALLEFHTDSQTIDALVTWHPHASLASSASTSTPANRIRQSLMP